MLEKAHFKSLSRRVTAIVYSSMVQGPEFLMKLQEKGFQEQRTKNMKCLMSLWLR